MNFKSHNVLLPDGKKTLSHSEILLSESLIIKAIKNSIKNFIGIEKIKSMRAVDLACMEGGYSVELARLGFETVGIDDRNSEL